MRKRLMNLLVITTAGIWALTGCDNSTETTNQTSDSSSDISSETAGMTNTITTTGNASDADTVDWSIVASGEEPAERADYQYPFALDSQNVLDYAEYFDVDAATAQHNLTVSMASNEALSKTLDQLSETYVSHELEDGNNIKLIIHTTPDVAASNYDYVLSDEFAKGLVLPVEIVPDGKKGDVKSHGEMVE